MRDRGLSHRGATLGRLGERRSGTARREERKKMYNHKKKKKKAVLVVHTYADEHTLSVLRQPPQSTSTMPNIS